MGCAVNGPGEARMADLGIACGRGMGLIFQDGKIVASLPEDRLIEGLMDHVWRVARERYGVTEIASSTAPSVPVGGGGT